MESKICSGCSTEKELSEFHLRKSSKDGHKGRCKDCLNEWKRGYIKGKGRTKHIQNTIKSRQSKSDYVNSIKANGCSICGYNKCLRALTFHHLDPLIKIDSISNLLSKSAPRQRIDEEIKKCILVCANCHTEIHDREDYGINTKYKLEK